MERKQQLFFILFGFMMGVLLTSAVWFCVNLQDSGELTASADVADSDFDGGLAGSATADQGSDTDTMDGVDGSADIGDESSAVCEDTSGATGMDTDTPDVDGDATGISDMDGGVTDIPDMDGGAADMAAVIWDMAAVYTGGDTVNYNGCLYRARWWTQGEVPDTSDVWEDLGILDGVAVQPEGTGNIPIDASIPHDTEVTDFKVVGYYPSWKPDRLQAVDFSIVTHVCYAFAIPTAEGGLLDLENADTAKTLIRSAHDNGAKVLLSVGGWSYNDTPLENVFMEATSDETRLACFVENIVDMCQAYGFDGVDMDWEHPRVDGSSARQYEALMLALAEELHAQGRLLTAAVLSGATADGNIYYDAAAHTNAVLNAVDFINVMAYDGGDGERHSSYQFAVDCGAYWRDTRGLPAYKVVLGVPFYARPGWADYGSILASVPDACKEDHAYYNGMEVYYNGPDTIADKTHYAAENLGGIMVWELTQDTADGDRSLLQAIGKGIGEP